MTEIRARGIAGVLESRDRGKEGGAIFVIRKKGDEVRTVDAELANDRRMREGELGNSGRSGRRR